MEQIIVKINPLRDRPEMFKIYLENNDLSTSNKYRKTDFNKRFLK